MANDPDMFELKHFQSEIQNEFDVTQRIQFYKREDPSDQRSGTKLVRKEYLDDGCNSEDDDDEEDEDNAEEEEDKFIEDSDDEVLSLQREYLKERESSIKTHQFLSTRAMIERGSGLLKSPPKYLQDPEQGGTAEEEDNAFLQYRDDSMSLESELIGQQDQGYSVFAEGQSQLRHLRELNHSQLFFQLLKSNGTVFLNGQIQQARENLEKVLKASDQAQGKKTGKTGDALQKRFYPEFFARNLRQGEEVRYELAQPKSRIHQYYGEVIRQGSVQAAG